MRLYMEFEPSGSDDVFDFETSFPVTLTKEQATSMFREMLGTATAYVQTIGINTSKDTVETVTYAESVKEEKKTKHMRSGYLRTEDKEETIND